MMTPVSYSACCADLVGDAARVAARRRPRSTSLTNQRSSVSPVGHREARHVVPVPSVNATSHRSAMSSVLSQASGSSANSCAHLRRRLQVVAVAVELEPVRVGHRRARTARTAAPRGRRRRPRARSAGRWWPPAAAAGPWRSRSRSAADPVLDRRGRGPSARRSSCSAPKMSRNSAATGDRLVVLAEPQVGLHLARRAAGGGDQALAVRRRAVRGPSAACRSSPRCEASEPSRNRLCMPVGVLGQQRHVGVRAAAGHVVARRRRPTAPACARSGAVSGVT